MRDELSCPLSAEELSTRAVENHAHCGGDCDPLAALGLRCAPSLRRDGVVLAESLRVALPPLGREQAFAVHLAQDWVNRALAQLELPGTAQVGLVQDFEGMHGSIAEQRQNQ